MLDPADLPPSYRSLLEDAQSEAKRCSSQVTGLLHLAIALSRRDPQATDHAFGEGAAARFSQIDARVDDTSAADALAAFLAENAQEGRNREQLLAELAKVVAAPAPASAEATHGNDATTATADIPPTPSTTPIGAEGAEPADDGASQRLRRTERYVTWCEPDVNLEPRPDVVQAVLGFIGRSTPVPVVVAGPAGCGRTALLGVLAAHLCAEGYRGPLAEHPVLRVVPERLLMTDQGVILQQILEDAAELDPVPIVAIDDLEVVAGFGADNRAYHSALMAMRYAAGTAQVPLILTVDERYLGRLAAIDTELSQELGVVKVESPSREATERIVARAAERISAFHGVTIDEAIVRLALAPVGRQDTDAHPALAIGRIDAAAARASARAAASVADDDLDLGGDPSIAPPDVRSLRDAVRRRVVGQDHAVDRIAGRVALARAGLDLRPDRPDGVFLFVGPTGVGKTELARATAEALFGDQRRLIRLDMSEYAGEWAISQLIGPPPGYVGSTDPENWLTTKVRNQPEIVLLLDEIEKASPRVWNTFLQVFDAGRLTDSHGRSADFSKTIIIMTSNLGAEAFAAKAVGFGTNAEATTDEARVLEKVKAEMAPELINRLDDVVVFQPLSHEAIRAIAQKEVDEIIDRLRERGYVLSYDAAVIDHLAETGYSPAYGARHLQRNIEELLLQPLTQSQGRSLHAALVDGAIVWTPAP